MVTGTLDSVLRLEIPPLAEFVSLARLVVATAAKSRRSLDDERVAELALALSEACTNAIEAHEGHADGERVTVSVDEDDERLVVTIADRGPGFDPLEVQSPPAATDPDRLQHERGLGIPIIKTLVDEVTFRSSEGGGTTVTMTLHCPPASESLVVDDFDVEDVLDVLDIEAEGEGPG